MAWAGETARRTLFNRHSSDLGSTMTGHFWGPILSAMKLIPFCRAGIGLQYMLMSFLLQFLLQRYECWYADIKIDENMVYA